MWAHESRIRSRLWFSINLFLGCVLAIFLGLEHAAVARIPLAGILVVCGVLLFSVSAESIYSGNVCTGVFAISRQQKPFFFWLIVMLHAILGLESFFLALA